MPGPVPKHSTERRRRNADSKTQRGRAAAKVRRPAASRDWHPLAKSWYASLAKSGQADFYEPSDWQAAKFAAETISRTLNAEKLAAQSVTVCWTMMTDLLTTEASRRRMRLELERTPEGPVAPVAVMDDYRDALG